ncbi:MAG: hypothetical protein JXD23_11190 [Spirochaetales bacterium]|nr:hypothetical protein [Spirochaetales bacterium]
MSINGVASQAVSMYRSEIQLGGKIQPRAPLPISGGPNPTEDYIDIKAMKAILYLGIKGEVYLPLDEGHSFSAYA